MSRITLDPELTSKLNGMIEPLELCDETGTTLGRFVPENDYFKLLYAAVESACPHDATELQRRQNEPGGLGLAEFWESFTKRAETPQYAPASYHNNRRSIAPPLG